MQIFSTKFYLNIFKTATLRQSFVTTLGTIANGILGGLFYVVVARSLGPADFGALFLAITFMTLIADIFDLGINTGIVRFVPKHLVSEETAAFKFLKLSLIIKLVVGVTIFLASTFISSFIAIGIFGKSELEGPIKWVMFGVLGALLYTFATASLQAFQKFVHWSVINILINTVRLGLIVLLIYASSLNLITSIQTYILLPFFGFFIALLILPAKRFLTVNNEWSVFKQLFKYSGLVSIFALIAALSSRLDTFLVGKLLNTSEVGIYGAASQLTQVLPQLVVSIGVVVAPKFASFSNKKDMLVYFKKLQLLTLGIAAAIILVLPLAYYLIPLFLGKEYVKSIPIFLILVLANLIFLISTALHNCIFYYFSKPQLFIWIALGHLLIIGFFGYFAVLNFGLFGAAITVLLGMLFNFLAPLAWFFTKINLHQDEVV